VLHSLAPLRKREFRLLFFARTISFVGGSFAIVALASAVLAVREVRRREPIELREPVLEGVV
jgi:hypothetical protein